MKLSVVLSGRDDDYGQYFIQRLKQSILNNLKILDKSEIDYEMILVDFNPLDQKYLYNNQELKNLLFHDRIKNIIVDNSVICNENLNPTTYYEFFAKNVGCRHSSGEFIFITNGDIVLTEDLVNEIKSQFDGEDINDVFYRVRYRGEIELGTIPNEHSPIQDLNNPDFFDACICGLYSGDATMFSREVFFNVATGYNECEENHRTELPQASMDGEILWNLYKKGKQLKFLNCPYYHINHDRPNLRDQFYSQEEYINKEYWGFINYNIVQINRNTKLIKNT